ncbi:MAG: DedA family protein [Nitrospirae bacterium]|nr:DedA family protein [Candidatus Troglogloeales bacterium]
METLYHFIDLFLHLDRNLAILFEEYGAVTYFMLFLIIFCETGLVITPFLPGDSLLFAVGTLSANIAATSVGILWVAVLLTVAAILGDAVNYAIGVWVGPKIFTKEGGRYLNRDHLLRAHQFYERHGRKTIIFARFIPIIRTFAPFVAGCGKMTYWRFAIYNVIGGIAWVALFLFGGYFFGNLPSVKNNFTAVILAIIFISILPGVIEFAKKRK